MTKLYNSIALVMVMLHLQCKLHHLYLPHRVLISTRCPMVISLPLFEMKHISSLNETSAPIYVTETDYKFFDESGTNNILFSVNSTASDSSYQESLTFPCP